jgi:hypothetical protein
MDPSMIGLIRYLNSLRRNAPMQLKVIKCRSLFVEKKPWPH